MSSAVWIIVPLRNAGTCSSSGYACASCCSSLSRCAFLIQLHFSRPVLICAFATGLRCQDGRFNCQLVMLVQHGMACTDYTFSASWQYIEPTIRNSMKPMRELNWVIIVERVLKLAIPTLYVWLVMFYTLFHVWLNILAELLRFGDREFYKVCEM